MSLYGVFLLIHLFVIAAGLVIVQAPKRLLLLAVALLIQVPAVSSPVIEYRLGIGAIAFVGVSTGGAWFRFFIGSDWHFTLMRPLPWGVGVNLAPSLIFCGVLYYVVRQRVSAGKVAEPSLAAA